MLNVIDPGGTVQISNGAVYTPSGGRVIFVHHNLPSLSDLPPGMQEWGRSSTQLALSLCRADRGDVIQYLPGHSESIAADGWSNLAVAGVTVRGPSVGTAATITWSATTSTLLMDKADFTIDGTRPDGRPGIRMVMCGAGIGTVAAPITVTGARNTIRGCFMKVSHDANDLVTDAIHVNAVEEFHLTNCWAFGDTGTPTTFLKTTGAAHKLRITGNYIQAPIATAASGPLIDISNAAISDLQINGNYLDNSTAASVVVVKVHASSRGEMSYNRIRVEKTADAATALGLNTFTTEIGCFFNQLVDDGGLASVLMGTAAS